MSQSRALSARGSLSGAIIGGSLFGIGMVLARGCASRLLVLSATGNARALIAGLVFVVAAQASYQVALAYGLTYRIGMVDLDASVMRGITFSSPSAEVLMRALGGTDKALGFDTGLVPGVFLGSALAAFLAREWQLVVFDAASGMLRYMFGAVLMGFGAILAGGCAVGAGVSGGAIFSFTAWLALLAMWVCAGLTHWLVDADRRSCDHLLRSI